MPKTSLDPQTVQQLKKLFVESLNGKDTLIFFGHRKMSGGILSVPKPEGVTDYEVFITQRGASTSGYTYSVEYLPNNFTIHSSNSGDTSEISYMIIGN